MKLASDRALLDAAGVKYRSEQFLNNFWGTRLIFPNLKEARKASKIIDPKDLHIHRYWKEWAIEYY